MKTLYEKVMQIYPELVIQDFDEMIILQNDADGNGDYIKAWGHPTLAQPTPAQLAAIA